MVKRKGIKFKHFDIESITSSNNQSASSTSLLHADNLTPESNISTEAHRDTINPSSTVPLVSPDDAHKITESRKVVGIKNKSDIQDNSLQSGKEGTQFEPVTRQIEDLSINQSNEKGVSYNNNRRSQQNSYKRDRFRGKPLNSPIMRDVAQLSFKRDTKPWTRNDSAQGNPSTAVISDNRETVKNSESSYASYAQSRQSDDNTGYKSRPRDSGSWGNVSKSKTCEPTEMRQDKSEYYNKKKMFPLYSNISKGNKFPQTRENAPKSSFHTNAVMDKKNSSIESGPQFNIDAKEFVPSVIAESDTSQKHDCFENYDEAEYADTVQGYTHPPPTNPSAIQGTETETQQFTSNYEENWNDLGNKSEDYSGQLNVSSNENTADVSDEVEQSTLMYPQDVTSWPSEEEYEKPHYNLGASMGSAFPQKQTTNWRNKDDRRSLPVPLGTQNPRWFNKESNFGKTNRNKDDRYSENADVEYKKFCEEERRSTTIKFTKVEEKQQDLFEMSKEYSLGHCVAEDMRMGSGIAVNFKREFKDTGVLLNQRQKQGGLAVLDEETAGGTRYIYYLVTKRESNGKPTYEKFWSSLKKMRNHIQENNVKKLAIPRLGCGLDRLEWSKVKHMIEFLFREVDVEIVVCNFQQPEESPEKPQNYKCKLVHEKKSIADIEEETTIIFLSTEDSYVSKDMEQLDKKFAFLREFKSARKQLGEVIKYDFPKKYYILYGCIVKKTQRDPFDFVSFQKCISQINRNNRKDKYIYIAMSATKDNSDDLFMEKIVTILRHYISNVDIYVCWDGELADDMPKSFKEAGGI